MTNLVIVGAGGFGREVLQYAQDHIKTAPDIAIKGFLDDNPASLKSYAVGLPLLASIDSYDIDSHDVFLIAIGDPKTKRSVAQRLESRGTIRYLNLVHSTAYIATTASLGKGCIIAPFAFVGPYARLEDFVTLNTYSSCGHDSQVGRFCVLSPYAVINGSVILDEEVFLGTHATVIVGKHVGKSSKLSAGAVATRNIPAYSLAVGNPAASREIFAR